MTSSINFTDLKQKMVLLKEMKKMLTEPDFVCGSARHKRYIELRKEVSRILAPLFEDLNETGMMILWTKRTNDLEGMVFNGLNSGIQFSARDIDEYETVVY